MLQSVRRLDKSKSQAAACSLLYAPSSTDIPAPAYHGKPSVVHAFLLAPCWCIWRLSGQSGRRIVLSAPDLGSAVLDESWPALLLPIALFRLGSRRWRGGVLLAHKKASQHGSAGARAYRVPRDEQSVWSATGVVGGALRLVGRRRLGNGLGCLGQSRLPGAFVLRISSAPGHW